ncbi:MAG: hypothetical protein E7656_02805 [Ruminococcaceae bacterium]|nr:hypothetical protein [Oscillospiraceae bacterium]
MKKEDLFEALGNIDENLTERAEKRMENKKRNGTGLRVALIAACFAAVVCVCALPHLKKDTPKEPDPINLKNDVTIGTEVQSQSEQVTKPTGEQQAYHGVVDTYVALSDVIVVNHDKTPHTGTLNLPIDYIKREEYSKMKLSGDAWAQITKNFEDEIGISYETFGINLSEMWELSDFYGVTVRSYKNPDPNLDEYLLSDYGFSYSGTGDKAAFVSVSAKSNPFLTVYYNFEPFKDAVSTINLLPVIIVENNSVYHASFKMGDLSYYVAFVECTEDEVVDFLRGLTTVSVSVNDLPSDVGAFYAQAITADMLTDETEDIFCGAYIDGAEYIVLLTEVNDENINAVCNAFGIDKKNTVFKQAKYTLSYLTDIHETISEMMMAHDTPFIVSCGVYEMENRVAVGVLETASEDDKQMIRELDSIGGAIEFETSRAITTYELVAKVGE